MKLSSLKEILCVKPEPPETTPLLDKIIAEGNATRTVQDYLFTPTDKAQAIHNKAKLYEMGGTRKGLVNKWNQYK